MSELVNTDRRERQEQIDRFIHLLWDFRQEEAGDSESAHKRISAEMEALCKSLKIEKLGGSLGFFDISKVVAGFCQRAIYELEKSDKPMDQKALHAVKWFSDGVEAIRLGTDYDAVKSIKGTIEQQGIRIQKAIWKHVLSEGVLRRSPEFVYIANALQQVVVEMLKSDEILEGFREKAIKVEAPDSLETLSGPYHTVE